MTGRNNSNFTFTDPFVGIDWNRVAFEWSGSTRVFELQRLYSPQLLRDAILARTNSKQGRKTASGWRYYEMTDSGNQEAVRKAYSGWDTWIRT